VHARSDLVSVSDGSGLSELDRVTARSMVELLGYAHASPWSSVFHASLPVEGESGTLRRRKGTPARGNLHAKTGTTNTVASLGGFVTARNGEVLAFSFIYNGNDRWNAKSAMDTMGATLAEFSRER
jgi:D-alanyl-D-alanine carboxypeptidase/D-alanyl-D-alanine-endopeptidase (penicillin-binding protein 4)